MLPTRYEKLKARHTFIKTDVIDIIELLRLTPSKNEKTELVRRALLTNENFRHVITATYDKFYVYGIKDLASIPKYKNTVLGTGQNALGIFCTKFLMKVLATGNADQAMKNSLSKALDRLSKVEVKVVQLILNRNLDCGISKSTINKAQPNFLPEFPVQLCQKANDKTLMHINYPAMAQLKMDGLRCLAFIENGVVKFRTRNSKILTLHGALDRDALSLARGANIVIDGELIAVGQDGKLLSRIVSNGLANKAVRGTITEDDALTFVFIAWDLIPLDKWKEGEFTMPCSDRYIELNKRISASKVRRFRIVETVIVNNIDEAKLFYMSKIKIGEEGIILKNKTGIWNGKRSKDCLKFKVELEGEFRITGITEGTGKFKGFLGAFSVESEDGIVVTSVGTGLSAEQRDEYYTEKMIGKIITVKYNELITNKLDPDHKSLFLPVFVEVRSDKSIADNIDKL